MARLIAACAEKHKFSPAPDHSWSTSRRRGRGGFLHVKGKKVTPIPSSSPLQPLHDAAPPGCPSLKDLSPIARMALDEFILW